MRSGTSLAVQPFRFHLQYRGCGFNPHQGKASVLTRVGAKPESRKPEVILRQVPWTLNMAHIKTALKKCIPIHIRAKYRPTSLIQGTRTSSIQRVYVTGKTPGAAGGVAWSWWKQDRVSAQEGEELRGRMAVRECAVMWRIPMPLTAQVNIVQQCALYYMTFTAIKNIFKNMV